MFKFKFMIFIVLLSVIFNIHADIKVNENIYSDCRMDALGVMTGCKTRQESIENIILFKNRTDIKLHYVFNYIYSCNANFLTDIELETNEGSSLGKFKYLGGTFENDANGTLSIKDFDPFTTGRAKYDKNCKLSITSIEQDLSPSAITSLHKDTCTMDVLNNNIAQSGIVLSLAQSLVNNVGTLTVAQINAQLNLLVINLQTLKNQTSDAGIQSSIESLIGNTSTTGTVKYILKNDPTWGQGAQQLVYNMNLLYNNMQTILTNMNGKTYDSVMVLYNSNRDILGNTGLKSASKIYSNLMFEYSILQGKDTMGFNKPDC